MPCQVAFSEATAEIVMRHSVASKLPTCRGTAFARSNAKQEIWPFHSGAMITFLAERSNKDARWRILAFASVAISLILVLLLGAFGAYRDLSQSRTTILASGEEIGAHHEGLGQSWLDARVAEARQQVIVRWSIVTGTTAVVLLLGMSSLYFASLQSTGLRQKLEQADMRRIQEVGQLAAGLAHEIRNPLHAIRLNLHTLRRSAGGGACVDDSDLDKLIEQSQEEIDRIDQLIRELLGYASPNEALAENIDACGELDATVEFLSKELQQGDIQVKTKFPAEPVVIRIDKTRFRQIMLNLLLNAKEAMTKGGAIYISLKQLSGCVEIALEDEGPGVPNERCEKIFEPFYTTKVDGTGFGLAIARRFVTDAGGSIGCASNGHAGAKFRITLPNGKLGESTGGQL